VNCLAFTQKASHWFLHHQGNVFIPDPIVRFVSLGCPSKENWSNFDGLGVFVQFDSNINEIEPFCKLIKLLYFDAVDANLLDLYNDTTVVKKTFNAGRYLVGGVFNVAGWTIDKTVSTVNLVPKTLGNVIPVVGFPVGFVGDRVADVGHLVGHKIIGGVGRSIYDHGKTSKKQLDQNQIEF